MPQCPFSGTLDLWLFRQTEKKTQAHWALGLVEMSKVIREGCAGQLAVDKSTPKINPWGLSKRALSCGITAICYKWRLFQNHYCVRCWFSAKGRTLKQKPEVVVCTEGTRSHSLSPTVFLSRHLVFTDWTYIYSPHYDKWGNQCSLCCYGPYSITKLENEIFRPLGP